MSTGGETSAALRINGDDPVHLATRTVRAIPRNDISRQLAADKIYPAFGLRAQDRPIRNPSTHASIMTGRINPEGRVAPTLGIIIGRDLRHFVNVLWTFS